MMPIHYRNMIAAALLMLHILACLGLWEHENQMAVAKHDDKELSHVKYGLFSVDEWKDVLAGIIAKKVEEFELKGDDRVQFRNRTIEVLHQIVDQLESAMKAENERSGFKGVMREVAMSWFKPVETMRKDIPRFADLLINYLDDPRNKSEIKNYLLKQFDELADRTMGETDYTTYREVLERYHSETREECFAAMDSAYNEALKKRNRFLIQLAIAQILLIVFALVKSLKSRTTLLAALAGSLALLICGVSLPMIDIEASISSFSFMLAGEPVRFIDQVLFFQSKSIVQVVEILFVQGDFALVVVAILILSFSILIPLSKLLTTTWVSFTPGRTQPGVVRWLVFRSAKWSMADVMVVAIFMAFIGFNGVINSQLTQIKKLSSSVEVFTTNNSSLQVGFFLFLAYSLSGLLLSPKKGE